MVEWKTAEGFGREWWSNWMETWATICHTYIEMGRQAGDEWALSGGKRGSSFYSYFYSNQQTRLSNVKW